MQNIAVRNAVKAVRPDNALDFFASQGGYVPGYQALYLPGGLTLPRMAGGAKGYNDTDDSLRTLDGVAFPTLYTDLINSLADYNRIASELLSTLCFQTQMVAVREITPGSMRFERGTEYGRPDRQRAHRFRSRGLPVEKFALGIGFTRDFLLGARQAEIDAQHSEALRADMENLLVEILRAAFNDDNYSFEDDVAGTIAVKALYNGDSEVPPAFEGRTFTAPHTHYHSSNGALALADITVMKTDLVEHGHDGDRILYIAANLEGNVRALVDGAGNPAFFRNLQEAMQWLQMAPGATETFATLGPEFIGVVEGFKVRVINWLPDNYLFGYNSYGANSQMNPFGFREKENRLQRGLQIISDNPRYPLQDSFYERWFGIGVINRGNGTVMVVDAGASYIEPTFVGAE